MSHKQNLVNLLCSFPNTSKAGDRQIFIDRVGLSKLAKNISVEGNSLTFFNHLIDVVVKTDGPDRLLAFLNDVMSSEWVGRDRILTIEKLKAELEKLDPEQWEEDFGYVARPDPEIIDACPYQGLSAFREENAQYFFGREEVAKKLTIAAESRSLVAVVGASGSGKSSLVFAGLIPQLRSRGNWTIADFRPGQRPFYHLAAALVPLLEPEMSETDRLVETKKLATAVSAGDLDLADAIAKVREKQNSDRLLLVADQFEELYALCRDKKLQSLFLERLLAASDRSSDFTLVLTLRADFYGYALSNRAFADALQNADLKLGPMNRHELENAVVKPAAILDVRLQSGLSDRILAAVGEEPGNLPLLEFALTELWKKQTRSQLTHQAYEEIGGVEQALVKYADRVYEELEEGDRQRVRRAFIQLVTPGEGTQDTRRTATAAELRSENWDIIKRLADSRLVVTGSNETGEETVEVIHEALIREWGKLREWIEASRRFLTWLKRLRERMREWEEKNKDEGALLRGASLVEAQEWQEKRSGELSSEEGDFIGLSLELRDREERERRTRRQRTIFGLAIGLTTVSIFAAGAVWQWRRAVVGERNAVIKGKIAILELLVDTTLDRQLDVIALGKELQADWVNLENRVRGAVLLQQTFDFEQWKERNTLQGHQDKVDRVSFSPDGNLIASADYNTVLLWKLDGTPVATLQGHQDRISHVSFSPDGNKIASASHDKTVLLWKPDGTAVATLQGHQDKIFHVSFSPDGNLIASASLDKTVRLWKPDGTAVATLQGHQNSVTHVSFSPDGKLIASASLDDTVRLWKADGTPVATLQGHQRSVYHVSFSPDDKLIASASLDGTVRLWKADGTPVATLQGHQGPVYHVSFSPDGNLIASAGWDTAVRLWKPDGTPVNTLQGHQSPVYHVSFSPDGNLIASASPDKTVRLWKRDGKRATLVGHQDDTTHVSFSLDSNLIASASFDKTVRLWKADGTPVATLEGHQNLVSHVSFSPKGNLIASASPDNTVRLWKPDGSSVATLQKHKAFIHHVSFSPDGNLIASASSDKTVRLWKPDGSSVATLQGHQGSVFHVSFSPDGNLIASASLDKTVRLWKADGTPVATLEGHQDSVWHVSFSPDGKLIASADDNTVRLWKPDGTRVATLKGHQDLVNHVSFSPDGNLIASASYDSTIRLWKPDGTLVNTLQGHQGRVNHVGFSPDGNLIASASYDSTIRLWKRDGTLVNALEGHQDYVNHISFGPDGNLIASASFDNTVRLWKADGTPVATLQGHQHYVRQVSFSPDHGKLIASASDDGTVRLWNFDLDALLIQGCDWVRDHLNTLPEEDENKHLCDDIYSQKK
ncbi:MAG: hypothetical protein F6J93_26975 [Oscillatoria sp. SIO1A7]|nr:hypothetical protein [Oscillatoria sp. SIO1A7]